MKSQLGLVELNEDRVSNGRSVERIHRLDSQTPRPLAWRALAELPGAERKRRRVRQLLFRRSLMPSLTDLVMFVCLLALFSVYCVSSVGQALGVRNTKPSGWKRVGRLSRQFQLALLFATALGFAGCVGYVGPDGPGFVGVTGPDVYVFGGGYHGHVHEFSHRGAVSRGVHVGGHIAVHR